MKGSMALSARTAWAWTSSICKRRGGRAPWAGPEIQKFVGALHGKRARKGVFITTGSFTSEATAYVEHIDPKVVGVKRVDSDYFEEA